MSEKWLPKLQETFRVLPIHHCINDPHPYWEESWTYPTLNQPNPPRFSLYDPRNIVNSPTTSSSVINSVNMMMGLFTCINK
jgi:hypothetical protein